MAVSIQPEGDRLIAGVPQVLFETGRVEALRDFDVYKGGQRFVMGARVQTDEQPVPVILNWPGLLKK